MVETSPLVDGGDPMDGNWHPMVTRPKGWVTGVCHREGHVMEMRAVPGGVEWRHDNAHTIVSRGDAFKRAPLRSWLAVVHRSEALR